MSTKDRRVELLQGTLELLILRTPLLGPAHGHAITMVLREGTAITIVGLGLGVAAALTMTRVMASPLRGRAN